MKKKSGNGKKRKRNGKKTGKKKRKNGKDFNLAFFTDQNHVTN